MKGLSTLTFIKVHDDHNIGIQFISSFTFSFFVCTLNLLGLSRFVWMMNDDDDDDNNVR